jgi:hypothetical protein
MKKLKFTNFLGGRKPEKSNKHKLLKLMFLCFQFLWANSIIFSQSYPVWFVYPEKIDAPFSFGYSSAEYYTDSLNIIALKNAAQNYALFKSSKIVGGQGFWTTEFGDYWMGEDIEEIFDQQCFNSFLSADIITKFNTDSFTIILASTNKIEINDELNAIIDLKTIAQPSWTDEIPKSKSCLYGVGVAPKYYYETSSWLEAERAARLSIARQIAVSISSLQKKLDNDLKDTKKEELNIRISNVKIVERWIDTEKELYYVLVKMEL